MVKLECDKGCKQEFVLIQPRVDIIRGDIQKVWIRCPHCGKEYISHYTNSGIRTMQTMQRVLSRSPQRNKRKTRRMIKDLKERIQVGMNRLREEIENEKN